LIVDTAIGFVLKGRGFQPRLKAYKINPNKTTKAKFAGSLVRIRASPSAMP
jgi:hypothetical protein